MAVSNTLNTANQDFAALLRQRRRDLDLTRTELARRVGCSPDTIKKLEEGERRPSKELAELLAAQLQIDAATRASFIHLARTRGTHTREAGPTNLPASLTSFVSREQEAAYIDSLLRRGESGDARLLTLLGPPGVGKSRLALVVAERLRTAFPDGVWFVPLATVEEPDQVLLLIAKTLAIADDGHGTPLEWLTNALRNRRMLLLLDNFEQVLDAAPHVTALLTACAHLSALITSRAPLEVYGEHQYTLQPLEVPPTDTWTSPAALERYGAVKLFVARVDAHNPAFRLTEDNCAAVAELCARLDGIPLALELAAGLTRAEAPHLLLADVTRAGRLDLLSTTQRDRTARQQTLREAIAWSVRRLADADQLLFARMGVFHGAFDLDAAFAVAGSREPQPGALALPDFTAHLQALVASHLVQADREPTRRDTMRYRLLETLREYALDALQSAGEMHRAQRHHAEHYAALAAAIDPAQNLGTLHAWRDQLRPDYPNLIAALQYALACQDVDLTLRLASGLGHYWYIEGSWQEGVRWLRAALTLPGGDLAWRARANTELGILYSAIGHYDKAEAHLHQARQEANQAGDLLAAAWTLAQLTQTALLQGQNAEARAYMQERLQIYRRLGDTRYLALTLEQMGCAAVEEGDYERGIPWLEECQVHWAAQNSRAGVAAVCLIIGMAELAQGDAPQALARFQQAYEEFDAIQHSHGLPWCLRNLGLAYIALGQLGQAQFSLRRSFERYAQLTGDETSTAVVVEAIAAIATRLGKHHLAGNLIGAAAVVRDQCHLPLTENSRQIYDRLLAASLKALGPEGWQQAIAVGATIPWTEAVASARALLEPQPGTVQKHAAPTKAE